MPVTKKNPLSKPKKDDDFEIEMPTNKARVGKGKHIAKLISVEKEVSKEKDDGSGGNPMWTWTFVVVEGPYAGEELKVWTALTPTAMWKVGEVLNALGLGTEPGQKVSFKRADAIGRLCVLNVTEDEFDGRPTSKVAAVLPHPKGAGYKKKGGPVIEESEDEDEELEDEDLEDEDEDLEDEDEDEEEDDDDEDEDDEEEEEEDEDEDEDEDEEDEPPPVKKSPAKKAAPPAKKAPPKRK